MLLHVRQLGLPYSLIARLFKRESPVEAMSPFMTLPWKSQFFFCHIPFFKELTKSGLVQGKIDSLSLDEECQRTVRAGGTRMTAAPVFGKDNLPQG